MSYKLHYSDLSENDLQRIKEDIVEVTKSASVAKRYLDNLMKKIEKKKEFPFSGTPLYFYDFFTGFYYIHFKAYNAFYRVVGEYMEVLRVLPSKSDYYSILLGEYYTEDLNSVEELLLNDYSDEEYL